MTELTKWLDARRSPMELIERLFDGDSSAGGIKVEEVVDGNTLVIRAELPGIDPEKDAEITVSDGGLTIRPNARKRRSTRKRTATARSSGMAPLSAAYLCRTA